jgi:YggT family protein
VILGHLLRSLAQLINLVVQAYIFVILVRAVLSWVGPLPPSPLIVILRRLTDPVFRLIHRWFPFTVIAGVDLSPIIVMIGLYFINNLITGILLGYAGRLLAGG